MSRARTLNNNSLLGLWLHSLYNWSEFVTLTYSVDRPLTFVQAEITNKSIHLLSRKCGNFLYISVLERTKAGNVHAHLLVAPNPSASRINYRKLHSAWKHGFVWIRRYHLNDSLYIQKDFLKSFSVDSFIQSNLSSDLLKSYKQFEVL